MFVYVYCQNLNLLLLIVFRTIQLFFILKSYNFYVCFNRSHLVFMSFHKTLNFNTNN